MANLRMMMMIIMVAVVSTFGEAKTIVVGGNNGWKTPPTSTSYSDWASGQTFSVNDVLVFRFVTGGHTVVEATESAYRACDDSAAIKVHSTGPVSITLNKPGQMFFFCSIHCGSGQKFSVTVTGGDVSTSSAPAPSPSRSMSATSSSAPLSNSLVSVLLLIIATALMLFSV